jgi:hypothetical protein
MKLHLKPEFIGLIISRTLPGIGTITLNTNEVKEETYSNYALNGFKDIFTECNTECTCEQRKKLLIESEADNKTAKKKGRPTIIDKLNK